MKCWATEYAEHLCSVTGAPVLHYCETCNECLASAERAICVAPVCKDPPRPIGWFVRYRDSTIPDSLETRDRRLPRHRFSTMIIATRCVFKHEFASVNQMFIQGGRASRKTKIGRYRTKSTSCKTKIRSGSSASNARVAPYTLHPHRHTSLRNRPCTMGRPHRARAPPTRAANCISLADRL